jgi:parallel beta helix pectate lyase-like protein
LLRSCLRGCLAGWAGQKPGRRAEALAPQMRRPKACFTWLLLGISGCAHVHDGSDVRAALQHATGVVELPAGVIHLDRPIVIPKGTQNVILRGNNSTLVLDPVFQGSAAVVADGVSNVTLSGFAIAGDRVEMKSEWYLPLKEAAFADYYTHNGIVVRNSTNVTIRGVHFSRIRAFPVIINATAKSLIQEVTIEDCGTLNGAGHNNTTGGILIEEGSSGFSVRDSKISRVAGNAIWTHSYARSPRQSDGEIRGNEITTVGRDAIQVGHATGVRVESNHGSQIGFPVEYVDFEGYGTPVALDTAGNVDHSVYTGNEFTEVAGQCIDLDGFHDGEVTGNLCINQTAAAAKWLGLHFGILFGNHDPGMTSTNVTVAQNTILGFAYGGVFLIGDHIRIEDNRFLNLNLEKCGTKPISAKCNALNDQPDALRSGIYLSDNGGRPAETRDDVIRNNVITGFGMAQHCISARAGVGLKTDTIKGNQCEDQ